MYVYHMYIYMSYIDNSDSNPSPKVYVILPHFSVFLFLPFANLISATYNIFTFLLSPSAH